MPEVAFAVPGGRSLGSRSAHLPSSKFAPNIHEDLRKAQCSPVVTLAQELSLRAHLTTDDFAFSGVCSEDFKGHTLTGDSQLFVQMLSC